MPGDQAVLSVTCGVHAVQVLDQLAQGNPVDPGLLHRARHATAQPADVLPAAAQQAHRGALGHSIPRKAEAPRGNRLFDSVRPRQRRLSSSCSTPVHLLLARSALLPPRGHWPAGQPANPASLSTCALCRSRTGRPRRPLALRSTTSRPSAWQLRQQPGGRCASCGSLPLFATCVPAAPELPFCPAPLDRTLRPPSFEWRALARPVPAAAGAARPVWRWWHGRVWSLRRRGIDVRRAADGEQAGARPGGRLGGRLGMAGGPTP